VEVLAEERRWLTPREVHMAARRAGLRVGLATVYRVLELLNGLGLAQAIADASGCVRFVLCAPGHHDHLVCRACGRVVDVVPCRVRPPRGTGFHIDGHALTFFGRCPDCAAGGERA
jgi:Fur family ferric uptake transcriptional regulator